MKKNHILHLGYLFYAMALFIHILIIAKLIPFDWVNGGRSESYEAQVQLSIVNIGIAFAGLGYVFINSNRYKLQGSKLFNILRWFLVCFWLFSFVLQLLGTFFEKFVMSLVVLLGVYVHYRMARLKELS